MRKINLLLILLNISVCSIAQDAKPLVQKSEETYKGIQSYAEMEMQVLRKDWSKTMIMKTWHDGSSKEQSLILITAPAKEKGAAFLKVGRDVWNWQPKIERVIKMPPSMMSDSWMGSDISNDDMVRESSMVNDYTHKIIKDTTIEGKACALVELIPLADAVVVWGKIHMYISKSDYLQLMVKFYDEDFYLVNTMSASDIGPLGGRNIPRTMTIVPADENEQKTILKYKTLDFNPTFKPNFFSVQNLKRMR